MITWRDKHEASLILRVKFGTRHRGEAVDPAVKSADASFLPQFKIQIVRSTCNKRLQMRGVEGGAA